MIVTGDKALEFALQQVFQVIFKHWKNSEPLVFKSMKHDKLPQNRKWWGSDMLILKEVKWATQRGFIGKALSVWMMRTDSSYSLYPNSGSASHHISVCTGPAALLSTHIFPSKWGLLPTQGRLQVLSFLPSDVPFDALPPESQSLISSSLSQ